MRFVLLAKWWRLNKTKPTKSNIYYSLFFFVVDEFLQCGCTCAFWSATFVFKQHTHAKFTIYHTHTYCNEKKYFRFTHLVPTKRKNKVKITMHSNLSTCFRLTQISWQNNNLQCLFDENSYYYVYEVKRGG